MKMITVYNFHFNTVFIFKVINNNFCSLDIESASLHSPFNVRQHPSLIKFLLNAYNEVEETGVGKTLDERKDIFRKEILSRGIKCYDLSQTNIKGNGETFPYEIEFENHTRVSEECTSETIHNSLSNNDSSSAPEIQEIFDDTSMSSNEMKIQILENFRKIPKTKARAAFTKLVNIMNSSKEN